MSHVKRKPHHTYYTKYYRLQIPHIRIEEKGRIRVAGHVAKEGNQRGAVQHRLGCDDTVMRIKVSLAS